MHVAVRHRQRRVPDGFLNFLRRPTGLREPRAEGVAQVVEVDDPVFSRPERKAVATGPGPPPTEGVDERAGRRNPARDAARGRPLLAASMAPSAPCDALGTAMLWQRLLRAVKVIGGALCAGVLLVMVLTVANDWRYYWDRYRPLSSFWSPEDFDVVFNTSRAALIVDPYAWEGGRGDVRAVRYACERDLRLMFPPSPGPRAYYGSTLPHEGTEPFSIFRECMAASGWVVRSEAYDRAQNDAWKERERPYIERGRLPPPRPGAR